LIFIFGASAHKSVFVEEKSDEESNNDIDYCNKISKDGYYKPEEIVLVRVAIQNFLKNPVISMALGLSDGIFSCFNFIKLHSF
jgi:hypothetical protein